MDRGGGSSRKRKRTSEGVMVTLRRMILCGELSAGQRLYEPQLCKILNVSRTPLRESLMRLQHEGLLEPSGSVGYQVRGFSRQDVSDTIDLRGVLEGMAARIAAERGGDPEHLETAWQAVRELDGVLAQNSGIEIDAYANANSRFHGALAWIGNAAIVAEQITRITRLPFASPSAFLHARSALDDFEASLRIAHAQHRSILVAIEGREGARAEFIAREHARIARDNLSLALERARHTDPPPPGLAQIVS